jgi:hypothetical protein
LRRTRLPREQELDTVWWPDWNPEIAKANLTGPMAVGAVFHWETAGMAIPSTLGEVVPLRKLASSGGTGRILGVHVRNFSVTPEGTHVRMEESWEGVSLPAQTKRIQDALEASLVRWLSFLKTRSGAPEAQVSTCTVQYSSGSKIKNR